MSKGKKNLTSMRSILSVLNDTTEEENRLMSICGVSYGRDIIEDAKQLSFYTPRPYLGYLVEAQNLISRGYSPSDVLSYFDTKLYEKKLLHDNHFLHLINRKKSESNTCARFEKRK